MVGIRKRSVGLETYRHVGNRCITPHVDKPVSRYRWHQRCSRALVHTSESPASPGRGASLLASAQVLSLAPGGCGSCRQVRPGVVHSFDHGEQVGMSTVLVLEQKDTWAVCAFIRQIAGETKPTP